MSDPPAFPVSDVVTVEPRGHVAIVWLDRPEQRNAMAPSFWEDFPSVVESVAADPDVRVLVVAAKGPAFTVGIDLAAFGGLLEAGDRGDRAGVARRMATYRQVKRMQRTFTVLADAPQPVVVATHGWCLGAGVDLITACDIRIAAADTVLSVRETRLAMVADVGTLQRLPRIIGAGRVADLVFTGRDVTAGEAAAMGLVDRVLPDREAAIAAALEIADQIATNSPLAVQGAKAVLRGGEGRSTTEALDYVALWNAAFLHSDDLGEAIRAFRDKRPPDFAGT